MADKIIEVPGVGNVSFPDSMSDDDISAAIRKQSAPPDSRTSLQRFLDSAGIPRHIGTMQDVKQGLKNIVAPEASPTSPGFGQTLPVVGPIFRAQRETFDQPGLAAKTYGSIPVVGPAGYRAGQQLESGDYAGAAGSALSILTQMLGMKGTNLPTNLGSAAEEAGNIATKTAPYAGKAAGAATVGTGVYKAIKSGNPDYLLTTLASRAAQRTAEGAVGGAGSLLQRLGGAMNPDVPTQFGNPDFSSSTISNVQPSPMQRTPIRGGSQVIQTFVGSTPEEISTNLQRIANNKQAKLSAEQAQRDAFIDSLRQRLALPPGPTELGPSSLEPQMPQEGVLPAARVQVSDPNSPMGVRDQYVTSVASPMQALSVNQARNLRQPTSLGDVEGYRQNLAVQSVRDLLERQEGAGATEADARMAQYAKRPWENQSITVPAKVTVGSKAASDADTSLFQKARSVLGEKASISQVAQLAQKMKTESQVPIPQEAAQYLPQPATNQSNLADLLTRSIRMARSRK